MDKVEQLKEKIKELKGQLCEDISLTQKGTKLVVIDTNINFVIQNAPKRSEVIYQGESVDSAYQCLLSCGYLD